MRDSGARSGYLDATNSSSLLRPVQDPGQKVKKNSKESRGDGIPYLMPLDEGKKLVREPLISTEK